MCVASCNLGILLLNHILQVIDLVLQTIKHLLLLLCWVSHYSAVWSLVFFLRWEEQ